MKAYLFLFICLISLFGCSANTNEMAKTKQNVVSVKNTTFQNVDKQTGQQVSQHLVELSTSIPNVNDATAVVIGPYAIVGIDVNQDLDRSEVGSIKYSVAESLKNDPYGARAVVIADPDMNARVKEISEDIRNGKPIQGILNELADISGRLMPEIPADLVNPKSQNTPEKLNNKDEQNLKKYQQEQSNQLK